MDINLIIAVIAALLMYSIIASLTIRAIRTTGFMIPGGNFVEDWSQDDHERCLGWGLIWPLTWVIAIFMLILWCLYRLATGKWN
jgi:ribose/xylose/arabinose/galactoside ABC-type transport system permease subunit